MPVRIAICCLSLLLSGAAVASLLDQSPLTATGMRTLDQAEPGRMATSPSGFGEPSAGPAALERGHFYEVPVLAETAEFELDVRESRLRTIIVSSLGASESTYNIRLQALPERASAAGDSPAIVGLRPVASLPQRTRTARVSQPAPPLPAPSAGVTPARTDAPGAEYRQFHLHVTEGSLEDARGYTRVRGRLVADGKRVRVYLDVQQQPETLTSGLVAEIVRLMDDEIISETQKLLGPACDVDGDGKFAILLTPWLGKLQGGRTSLDGCVRSSDFRRGLPAPFSNSADLLYLNTQLRPGAHLRALLAHEYTHAVCCGVRLAEASPSALEEDDWLNEAIAHVAESLQKAGWSNLDYRVAQYLDHPHSAPLVVVDYYRCGRWRDHGCRGATFLFLRWCVDQYGQEILRDLIEGDRIGVENIERVTGLRFAQLYRHWTMALLEGSCGKEPGGSAGSGVSLMNNVARLQSVPLCGPLGSVALQGPHCEAWTLDGSSRALQVAGTSTSFVNVSASPEARRVRVRLTAPLGCKLQVSVIER